SNRPDKRGTYAQTKLTSTVSSLRNTPNNGRTLYSIYGYVFNDLNHNAAKDVGETGIANAVVHCGTYSAMTSGSGYYLFQVDPGTYPIRNNPPMGYGVFNSPDSFVVSVPPATSRDLADTSMAGGWVNAFCYKDANLSTSYDAGDSPLQNILLT